MKKIISVLLVMVLALGVFAGCGAKTELEGTTTEILEKINEDAKVELMVETKDIPTEQAEYFTGLTEEDFTASIESGSVSEAMIGSQPHSMVMLKVKDGVDAEAIAKNVFDNIDTRKWICVSAESLYVNTSGDYVFMVMSFVEIVDSIAPAFETLAGSVGDAQTRVDTVE